ncbi:DUF1566 domain-containing protein [Cyclobacteriaceae bacterium YHN15]|jgi:hypothetical protein|nr:DUF1566 domain-containing protein [Cyclobacteriaceae bacterium YHN15]
MKITILPSLFLIILLGISCFQNEEEVLPEITLGSPESVSAVRAILPSSLNKDGTGGVIRRGITVSQQPNPDLSDHVQDDERFYGAFDNKIFNLRPNTRYYVRAFVQNKVGLAYSNEIAFETLPEADYSLLETGPGGGLVFVDLGNYDRGWRYMEALSFESLYYNTFWFDHQFIPLGTSNTIGSGEINSYLYNQKNRAINQLSSMQVLAEFNQNGYKDWFLPSIDELKEIREKLYMNELGGFEDGTYWSSTEKDDMQGWLLNFSNGQISSEYKAISNKVIAVRLF